MPTWSEYKSEETEIEIFNAIKFPSNSGLIVISFSCVLIFSFFVRVARKQVEIIFQDLRKSQIYEFINIINTAK